MGGRFCARPRSAVELRDAVERLAAAYQPERIYVFGSAAREEAGPDSDCDLLIVVPDDASRERRDGGMAYRVLWVRTPVDAVVCTSQWLSCSNTSASVAARCRRSQRTTAPCVIWLALDSEPDFA
jgi:predicted nucleotidyltransferase